MSIERAIVRKLFESKDLHESEFEAGGSVYKCVFGKYYKDNERITREDYFRAKEEGGTSGGSTQSSDRPKSVNNLLGALSNLGIDLNKFEQNTRADSTGKSYHHMVQHGVDKKSMQKAMRAAGYKKIGGMGSQYSTYRNENDEAEVTIVNKKDKNVCDAYISYGANPSGKPKVRHFVNDVGEDVFFIKDPTGKTILTDKDGKPLEDKPSTKETPANPSTDTPNKMKFKVVGSNDYFEESEADYKGYTVGRTHSKERGTDYYTIGELRGPQFSSEEEVQSIINDYQRRREETIDYSTLEGKGVDAGIETYQKLKKSLKKKSLADYYLVQRGRMATLERGFNLVRTKDPEDINTQLNSARAEIIKSEDFKEAQKVYKEKIVPYMYATGQCKSGMAGMAGQDSYTVSPDSEYSWSSMMKQNAKLRKHKPIFYK